MGLEKRIYKRNGKRQKQGRNQETTRSAYSELLPLTSDLVFKAVFGRDTAECKRLLIAALNLILDRDSDPITDLIYKNPFTYSERPDSKFIVMDIKALLSTGEWIDVEMQVEQLKNYVSRSVYYGAKLISEQLEPGQDYAIIKPGIVISIVCGRLFPSIEKAHTVFRYKERELNCELTDKSELHFLELDKIDICKPVEEMTQLEQLSAYIRYAAAPERRDYIQNLLNHGNEVISMTDKMLQKISEEEQMRELQRAREIFLWNQRCLEIEAERRGLEEGRAEGRAEGIEAFILDYLEEQRSSEQILAKLIKRFSLSQAAAESYLEKYT